MEAIVVDELRKRYGEVQALDGVSFNVQEGEVFGLLGPNGAGKSTTVRTLVTLTHADAGKASVAGHDVRTRPGRRAQDDRLRPAGLRRRPVRHRPREPDAPGPHPGDGRQRSAAAHRRAARAGRDRRRRRPHRQGVLGRHAPPARHRARPRPPPARAVPRRADDRPRPRGARRDVGRGLPPRRGGVADDPAHDALPRGGRPARRPACDRLRRARSSSKGRRPS